VHRSIESARRTYEHVTALLPNLDLTLEKHRQVQQELAELRYRLQALEQ
jgi:uncharacterized coiled-coil DUF342 family protein